MRMIISLLTAFIMLALSGCQTGMKTDMLPTLEMYEAEYTSQSIIVDGKLDEEVWKTAVRVPFFVYKTHGEPISRTEASILWDDKYLYVGFSAADKDVYAYETRRDASTCLDDVLEIFFNTDPSDTAYYNFEINALGTIYDAFTPKWATAGHTHRWKRWDSEKIKIGIQVRGTLNDHRDVDEGWDMEVAIPFEELETIGSKPPQPGDIWSFMLSRYDYSVYLPDDGRELSSTALFPETPVGGFHDQTGWGRLRFTKKP